VPTLSSRETGYGALLLRATSSIERSARVREIASRLVVGVRLAQMPREGSELSEKVKRSFEAKAEAAFAPRYVDALRENIRDAQLQTARVLAVLVLCVVVFFLLLKSNSGQITVFGITLKDVPLPT
jgi:hypothetical protein